jgi:hypothetical protein
MGLSICEFARDLVLDLARKQLVQRVLDSNGGDGRVAISGHARHVFDVAVGTFQARNWPP